MKRIFSLMLAALMLLALVSCSDDTNNTPDGKETTNGTTSEKETQKPSSPASVPVFVHDGVTIKMNEPAAPIIKALGDAVSVYEQPSCAFQGKDYVYNYGSFELTTYDNNGDTQYVYSVFIKDDLVTTPEGLYIGSPEADALAVYGESARTDNGNFIYRADGVTVTVIITDGKVTSIEYVAALDN